MKVLLSIGRDTFILPDDSGIQTLVKVLSKAVPACDRTYRTPPCITFVPEPLEVSVKYLTSKTKLIPVSNQFDDPEPERREQLTLEAPTTIIPQP